MPYQDKNGRTCGFLDLETKENSNHFMRRFFLLDYKSHLLQYYMDNPQNLPDSSAPVGTFNMHAVSMVDDGSWSRPKVANAFYITIRREKHYFKANDKEDRDGWIQALRNASKVVAQRTNSQEDTLGTQTRIVGGVAVRSALAGSDSDDISEDEVDMTSASSCSTVPDSAYCRVPPLKVGYCIKQGARMKNWKRRYFILDEDGLSYFKNAGEKAPIRTITWPEIVESRESIGIHITKPHVFEVVTPSRVFYVQAESEAGKESWIKMINSRKLNTQKETHRAMDDSRAPLRRTQPEVITNRRHTSVV